MISNCFPYRRLNRHVRRHPKRAIAVCPSGVTVIELLAVLAILGMLLSLFLPAVQAARESARGHDCRNRLRQLALAAHNFAEQHGGLPPTNYALAPAPTLPRTLSPWALMLPQLDQAALSQRIEMDPAESGRGFYPGPPRFQGPANQAVLETPLPIAVCPSDRTPSGWCNFRVCWGSFVGNYDDRDAPPEDRGGHGVWASGHQDKPTFAEITDGLSQTAMISERIVGDGDPSWYDPFRDTYTVTGAPWDATPVVYRQLCADYYHPRPEVANSYNGATWMIAGKVFTAYNHVLAPNSPVPDCTSSPLTFNDSATGARSWHPGVVHVAFADGSTRAVGDAIDLRVWRAMATRDRGETLDGAAP